MRKIACALAAVGLWTAVGQSQPTQEPVNLREKLLQQAFGKGSEELSRPIRLRVQNKGLVISTGRFSIEEDGRIKLGPCSIAQFSVEPGFEPAPPFTTIRSEWVLLTIDRPIATPSELAKRKLIALEFPRGLRVKVEP